MCELPSRSSWNVRRDLGSLFLCLFVYLLAVGSIAAEDFYQEKIVTILEDVCYDCHGEGMKKGGFALDKLQARDAELKDVDHWFSVWKNLKTQIMPPADEAQPSEEDRQLILRWIERAVFRVDPENPDPGRVTTRRLNRREYQNTIFDLLGVKFETDEAFPPDDTGYGFDTIGDVLTLSPILMEKYLEAGQKIVEQFTQDFGSRIPTLFLAGERFLVSPDKSQNARWLPFAKEVKAVQSQPIMHPGRYRITVTMSTQGSPKTTANTARLNLLVGEKPIANQELGWKFNNNHQWVSEADLTVGEQTLALVLSPGNPPLENQEPLALNVSKVELYGPLDRSYLEYSEPYYRVFSDGPPKGEASEKEAYRRKILAGLASKAFRRPVDLPTLERLIQLAQTAETASNGNFEHGINHALCAILISPRFLFRAEIQAEPNNPAKVVEIDEFALASRLSYFLWSSLPDPELDRLAAQGKLRTNLRSQVDRMLADPRSERLVENFVGQWLQTRDVEGVNVNLYRLFGESGINYPQVRASMRKETEMLFAQILAENRPVLELLNADYTYLNEVLADYYGIPGVKGDQMRKVTLAADSPRRAGVLTHGSTLMVTSNPTRTSPVKRGLFILDNILGSPAPPAPPNVPVLPETEKQAGNLTMRDLMEQHRKDTLCASCHARMDPLGLALEQFTYGGTLRKTTNDKPIDTSGQLITGEKFANVTELSQILVTSRKEDFFRCLSEKMLTYAIGRGLEYYDTATVGKVVSGFKVEQPTLRALIYQIVESAPFQKRRGDGSSHVTTK